MVLFTMADVQEQSRHRSESILSNRTNSTWRYDVFGKPRINRGPMVFTGPNNERMHRQVVRDPDFVGEGVFSPQRTSSALYLMRAAPGTPHPRPKSAYSNAIGWGAWGDAARICANLNSGHQIKLNTFRQAVEQQTTHAYQNAWYPGPNDRINPDLDEALMMNVYAPAKSRVYSRNYASSSPESSQRPTSGRLLNREQASAHNSTTDISQTGGSDNMTSVQ